MFTLEKGVGTAAFSRKLATMTSRESATKKGVLRRNWPKFSLANTINKLQSGNDWHSNVTDLVGKQNGVITRLQYASFWAYRNNKVSQAGRVGMRFFFLVGVCPFRYRIANLLFSTRCYRSVGRIISCLKVFKFKPTNSTYTKLLKS